MTLSSPEVSRYVNEQFVPCWQTVREVPQVTISFGGGQVLRRTLGGNTVFAVCLPDGRAVDALPGVYAPKDLLDQLRSTREFLNTLGPLTPANAGVDAAVKNWHKAQAEIAIRREALRMTISKAVVEAPLLNALALRPTAVLRPAVPAPEPGTLVPTNAAAANGGPPTGATVSKALVQSPLLGAVRAEAPNLAPAPAPPTAALAEALAHPQAAFARLAARIEDLSKKPATVAQLRPGIDAAVPAGSAVPVSPEELGLRAVAADSKINMQLTRPAIHLLFAGYDRLPTSLACRDTVYKELLHLPVDDPYLGLADALVPGTRPGEHH